MGTGKVKAMTIRTMKTGKVPKTTRTVKAVPMVRKSTTASVIHASGSTKTLTGNNQKTPGGVRSRAEKRLQNGPRIPHGNWALSATGPSQTSILKVARTKNGKKMKAQMHPSGTVQPTKETIRAKSGLQKTVKRTGPQPTP